MKSFAGKLTKAQQLNDLIRWHAENGHLLYRESWDELARLYFIKYGEKIIPLWAKYRQENNTKTTISQYLERSGIADKVIEICIKMNMEVSNRIRR
ncbi:MAG: hypothetical protein KKC46_13655 [Proteobacteria bacterium]|nr:hypothetical protein [Pseudomonadota bacterium]